MSRTTDPPWEVFQCISICDLPPPPFTCIQEGWKEQDHTSIINEKNKIAEFESQEEWEIRKKITNPYEAIFSSTDETSFPCVAIAQPLSRSYFKMIEMLQFIDFWSTVSKKEPFITAHVCEGPGGFIQCILQQAKQYHVSVRAMVAMTLKPTKSHIPGWRRSIGFLRKHPEILLEYGRDQSGDILLPENQKVFLDRVKQLSNQGVSIFTADGGFDFSVDYSKQELMVFPLLVSSFTIGLQCLKKGGTIVIKCFDMYSKATQDLCIGTSLFFDKFVIYKPATSRPCNSERYYIAKGYKGVQAASNWILYLQSIHAIASPTRLIQGEWPKEIIHAIEEQIQWQEDLQIHCIEDTFQLDKESLKERLEQSLRLSRLWCDTFHIPRNPTV
jgi:23S rRNA U2552 (ribose-2'-O)-methylase RlmE/FtsJ